MTDDGRWRNVGGMIDARLVAREQAYPALRESSPPSALAWSGLAQDDGYKGSVEDKLVRLQPIILVCAVNGVCQRAFRWRLRVAGLCLSARTFCCQTGG